MEESIGLEEHVHWNNKKFGNKIVGWYSLYMLQLVVGGAQSLQLGPALLLVTPLSFMRASSIPYLTINLHVFLYKNDAFEWGFRRLDNIYM